MSHASNDGHSPIRNELLAALPPEALERVRPHLRRVKWVVEQELHEVGSPLDHVFFPESGLVSLTADTGDNGFVEVGMTGREGMIGVAALLNPDAVATYRTVVQIGGTAWRVDTASLRELVEQVPALRDRCMRYLHFLTVQTPQAAACNISHALPGRLARWLLMVRDRVDGDEVPLVAGALQAQGLIQQSRGRLAILDREGLEKQACGCYRLIEDSRRQIMERASAVR